MLGPMEHELAPAEPRAIQPEAKLLERVRIRDEGFTGRQV